MNSQIPPNPPARRRAAIGPLQITAAVLALLTVILVVQNIRFGDTVLWFFGIGVSRLYGVLVPGLVIATGWVVLVSIIVGGVIGWAIARGIKPRR